MDFYETRNRTINPNFMIIDLITLFTALLSHKPSEEQLWGLVVLCGVAKQGQAPSALEKGTYILYYMVLHKHIKL